MAEAPTTAPETPAAPAAGQDALAAEIARLETLVPEFQQQQPGTEQQTPGPAAPPQQQGTTAPTEQPADTSAPEHGGPDEDTDEDTDEGQPQPQEQGQSPSLSRMGRLRQQLERAETESKSARERVQQLEAQHAEALRQFVDLVLPDATFEQLRQRAETGDWEARQQLETARQWRRMAAPIADLAHKAVAQQMDATLDELRLKHAWERDTLDKLKAADPPARLSLIYDLAKKAADTEHKERIAELEAEVKTLKTNQAANGSQPATGGVPRNGARGIAELIDPKTGLLTEEAQKWGPDQIAAYFGTPSAA